MQVSKYKENRYDQLFLLNKCSNCACKKKLAIFDACIISKLMYGLSSAVLTKIERKRLDAFHARCLRKIIRVAPAYYSRVSNITVFERAKTKPASRLLLKQQLIYFGQLACKDEDDPTRKCIFENGDIELRQLVSKRRCGRPRLEWAKEMHKHALQMMGSQTALKSLLLNTRRPLLRWKRHVMEYIS